MTEYLDFIADLTERSHIKPLIESDPGVIAQEQKLRKSALTWWELAEKEIAALPQTHKLMKLRLQLLLSFEEAVRPVGLLDRYKTMGVIVSWWEEAYESSADLRRLDSQGFKGLIESWVESIRDAVEDDETKPADKIDPLSHKVVGKLVPEYLQELDQAEAAIATLQQEKEAFEQGEEGDGEAEEGDAVNVVKELEARMKELKQSIKDAQTRIKVLLGSARKQGSIQYVEKQGQDTTELEQELADLQFQVTPVEVEMAEIEETLKPYREIVKKLSEARKHLRELKAALVTRLLEASAALSDEEAQRLVLDIFREELMAQLERYIVEHRQWVIAAVENWWDKYKVTLAEIEQEEEAVDRELREMLKGLGYVD